MPDYPRAQGGWEGALPDWFNQGSGRGHPLAGTWETWVAPNTIADGDLDDTNDRVGNGYQELRGLLHQANRHFIRVTWRWGLQFAMWVIVPDSHLGALCGAVQRHCDELREHLQHRGCRDRLANSNIAVVVD